MDIVDDLRDLNSMHTPKEASDIGEKAATEIERLRKNKADLVEELWGIALHSGSREASEMARAAIAKATGGK